MLQKIKKEIIVEDALVFLVRTFVNDSSISKEENEKNLKKDD